LTTNLYAYCGNNPTNRIDPKGNSWRTFFAIGISTAVVGLALLAAIPTGGGSLVLAGVGIKAATATTVANATVAAGIAVAGTAIAAGAIENSGYTFSKQSGKSDKERSTEHPSWVNRNNVDYSISAQKNATNLMNEKYGVGNWHSGPGTEFNKIVKWLQRCLGVK